jgi:hypothetical protein
MNLFDKIECQYNEALSSLNAQNFGEKTRDFIRLVKDEAEKIEKENKKRLDIISNIIENIDNMDIDSIKEQVEESNRLTEEIEAYSVHRKIIYSIIAAYNLVIRQDIHCKLEVAGEIKEKYKLVLDGLNRQYLYYQVIIETLMRAIYNIDL